MLLPPPKKKATPIATTHSQHLPQSFFARPAEVVAPELIACLLVKKWSGWRGVIFPGCDDFGNLVLQS